MLTPIQIQILLDNFKKSNSPKSNPDNPKSKTIVVAITKLIWLKEKKYMFIMMPLQDK